MSRIASIWADVDVIFCVLKDMIRYESMSCETIKSRKKGDRIRAPHCLVPFDRASKDLDRFPASIACGRASGRGSLANEDMPEIKKKKTRTWTKSTFPRLADSKVASKARCPFCAFPGIIYI